MKNRTREYFTPRAANRVSTDPHLTRFADWQILRASFPFLDTPNRSVQTAIAASFSPQAHNPADQAGKKAGNKDSAGMTPPDPLTGRQEAANGSPPAESAASLTRQGWAALEQGEPQQAVQHFRRALRLRPNHAAARSGIVEALKARQPVYRWLLGWFFWLSRFQPSTQIAVMIVAFLALRLINGVAAEYREWAPYLWPVLIVIFGLCMLLGLASPLFDVLLRLDPVGEKSLDEDQRRGANLMLFNLLAPLPLLVWFLMTADGLGIVGWILLTMVALPSSAIYRVAAGWPRWSMTAITLATVGMISPLLFASLLGLTNWAEADRSHWIKLSVYSLIAAQLAATVLLAFRGKR
jgi:hypothetical protein